MLMNKYVLESLNEAVQKGDLRVSSIVEAGDGNSFLIVISGDEATPTVAPPVKAEVEAKPQKKVSASTSTKKVKKRPKGKRRIPKAKLLEMILEYLPTEEKFARTATEIGKDINYNPSHVKSRLNELAKQGQVQEVTGNQINQRYVRVVTPNATEPPLQTKTRRLSFRPGQEQTVKG